MSEYIFCCPTCSESLVFEGSLGEATADCPNCGTVFCSPGELLQSEHDERMIDAARDDRLRDD